MRWMLAVAVMVQLVGSARADDQLEYTREVLARHAASSRTVRIGGAVVATATGVGLGVAGYYMVTHVNEGGFIDLSGLEKGFGYTMLAVGGVLAITGPVMLLSRTDVERMRDDVTDAQDARFARAEIAHRAASGHRTRMMLRGVGLTLAGLGALGATTALVAGDSIDRSTHNELLGAGIGLGIWGVGFAVGSLVETRWETMHGELQQPRVPITAGVVPVRGGAIAGVSGTF